MLGVFLLGLVHSDLSNVYLGSEPTSMENTALNECWSSDFSQAVLAAQKEKKILVLAFVGGGWCPWSEKMKQDVLNDPDFFKPLEGCADFVYIELDKEDSEFNRHWKQLLHIDQTPTLLLLDYSQEEIARFGFLALSASEYADLLVQQVQNFEQVVAFLKNPKMQISEEEMIKLYANAKKLSSRSYRDQILQIGLKNEKGGFFLLEKYADQLDKLKFKSLVVQKTRKELMDKDPDNRLGIQLKMAILEFQKLGLKAKKQKSVFKAISPLVHYKEKFGRRDPENLWKIEMMIAQFLFTKNQKELAQSHAKASLQAAPENMKSEVKDVVEYICKAP